MSERVVLVVEFMVEADDIERVLSAACDAVSGIEGRREVIATIHDTADAVMAAAR